MKDGLLHIPRCRGVGLEWNEEMVEATTVPPTLLARADEVIE
jgi:hypothetical protein